jgi:hypothetical protein
MGDRFLNYWFAGLMRGIESLDEPSRKRVLRECGKACAQSYTAQVFREARQNSTGADSFLQNLARRFPGAKYERTGSKTIKVTYDQCGCDLVRLGLAKSQALCECSAANLRENFQESLGISASVAIESSILRGGTHCVLTVSLENEI